MKKQILIMICTLQIVSCATIPDYKPVVDTSNIKNKTEYSSDVQECENIANSVDYSDQETIASLKGAAAGVGVVGAGVATTLGAGGVVLLPYVLPIYGLAAVIGARSNSSKTNAQEQELKAIVWNSCLKDRGYKVFSDPNR